MPANCEGPTHGDAFVSLDRSAPVPTGFFDRLYGDNDRLGPNAFVGTTDGWRHAGCLTAPLGSELDHALAVIARLGDGGGTIRDADGEWRDVRCYLREEGNEWRTYDVEVKAEAAS